MSEYSARDWHGRDKRGFERGRLRPRSYLILAKTGMPDWQGAFLLACQA
jgi:hypothetical protein